MKIINNCIYDRPSFQRLGSNSDRTDRKLAISTAKEFQEVLYPIPIVSE